MLDLSPPSAARSHLTDWPTQESLPQSSVISSNASVSPITLADVARPALLLLACHGRDRMKVLSTVLAIAFSGCMAACSYKAAPDKVVHAGGSFEAVVEYRTMLGRLQHLP
jgi:hypothetical protein